MTKASYSLIITEKPNASKRIAEALADTAPVKKNVGQVPYYEITHDGKKYVVACAVGHLYGLKEKEKTKNFKYPVFDIEWAPSSEVSKGAAFSKKYLAVLKKVAKGANEFIIATDFDIEGEVIGLNCLRYACKQKDGKRMKFSSQSKTKRGRSLETDPEFLLRLRDRAERLSTAFERRYKEYRGSYPIDPEQLVLPHREPWKDSRQAWEVWGALFNRAPTGTITGRIPAPATPIIVIRIAGKTYTVKHGAAPRREIARLIDVWHRHYVGQKILRVDHSGFLHIGLLYEFGQALGVGKLSVKDLAKRFSMKKTKISSAIRRYRRTTKDRSVS